MKKVIVLFLLLTVNAACCMAANIDVEISDHEPAVFLQKDIVFARYYTWPQAELKMDIFSPDDGKKHPAVILIPGGAWITAPRDVWNRMAMKLAENGFAAVSVEYRVIGAADYTEIIGDAKAAVRYLHAHADELGIDGNKIAAMGASAGGYLAVMLGVTGNKAEKFTFGDNLDQSSAVQAVIDCFGPTDLTRVADDLSDERKKDYASPSSFPSVFVNGIAGYKGRHGGSVLDTPETARDSNPLNYIDDKTPPFLIFHGDADRTVSLSQSKILHEALTAHNIDSTLYIINGGEHDAVYFHQPEVLKIILDFLNRTLNVKQDS